MCPSWKMMDFVNGVGMTSHVWNGKLKMFQTTNQYIYISGYIWVIYPHFPRLFLWFTCSFHPMLIKYQLIPYQVIQTWLDRILDTAEPWLGPDSWSTPSMGCWKNTYIGVLYGFVWLSGCKHNVKIQETHGFRVRISGQIYGASWTSQDDAGTWWDYLRCLKSDSQLDLCDTVQHNI